MCRIAEQYLKKGSKVYVEGNLQTRKWQDENGNDKYSTEVVLQNFGGTLTMLDTRSGGSDNFQPAMSGGGQDYVSAPASGGGMDDDIPF